MAKDVITKGLTLSVVGALAIFLASQLFGDAKAAVSEFRSHELTQARTVAELRAKDSECEQRLLMMEKKIDEIRGDVKLLLQRAVGR